MAIDFRPPEERNPSTAGRAAVAAPGPATEPARAAAPAATVRKVMLGALYAAALVFVVAGLAVLLLRPATLGAEVSLYVGAALVLTGLFDVVAAQLFKFIWARADRSAR